MVTIATYNPDQALTDVVQQPRASASTPTGAFGEGITAGISNIAKATADITDRIDTTAAEEALVQFERDKNDLFFNPETGYFNTQGRNAFDGASTTTATLEKLKKKYGDSLSPNARMKFDKIAERHVTSGNVDISRHASKGMQAWEVATVKAQVENTIESASLYWNQPDKLRVQNALGRQSVIDAAEMEGIGAEATNERLQTYDSAFAMASVQSAINSSSEAGQESLDAQSKQLEPQDRIKLEGMIASKAKAEKTQADAQTALATGASLVNRYDSRGDIVDQVNKIDDLELRKKTMSEAMRQFNLKKQVESEAQADAFESAEEHMFAGGSVETFQAEDPEGWDRLSVSQKRKLSTGDAVVTDWTEFSNLMTLPNDKLKNINPVDYFDKLAKSERGKLISAVKSANGKGSSNDKIDHQVGRTRTSQVSSAIEQVLGKKTKWNDDKRIQADAFYALVDDEVNYRESEKGQALTSKEFTDLLSELTRKVTIERSLFTVDFLVPDAERDFTDVLPENIDTLSTFLRNNGIPVTVDNLIKAQRQASE